jgi:hypothetical protein
MQFSCVWGIVLSLLEFDEELFCLLEKYQQEMPTLPS